MLQLSIKWERLDVRDLSCCNGHGQRSLHAGLASLLVQKSGLIYKKVQMNLFTNRNRVTDVENKLMVTKGEREGEG